MSMTMTTGSSHRSCHYSFMTCVSPCKLLYFIAKRVSHSSSSNGWRATPWRHDDGDHDDGDHGVMPVTNDHGAQDGDRRSYMMMAISCHFYIIACDVYYGFTSCLLRTTV